MNYEIDWQKTLNALIDIPSDIYLKYDIFDEIAWECEGHGAKLFCEDYEFYLTPDGECDII